MDIPREKKRSPKKYILGGVAVVGVVGLTVGLSRLKPAAPSVERAVVWLGEVQRRELVVQVRGPGTLVPEQIRYVSALTSGRVERKIHLPGDTVTPTTVILEMSNPDVQVELLRAEQQLAQTNASFISLKSTLTLQRLQQEAAIAGTRTLYLDAQRQIAQNRELAERNLVAQSVLEGSQDLARELEERLAIEERRLEVLKQSAEEQILVQQRQIERWEALTRFQSDRVASMNVPAGVAGVVRDMPLEEGQWVNSGELLAVVVQPGRLRADLRIPETQAQNVVIGQRAFIDTRTDTIPGVVQHVDPAAENGTVRVEVRLEDPLPRSARPDLSVDGTIEINRLADVMVMGRPAFGQAESSIGIFKLVAGSDEAVRVTVELGVSSVNEVEVRSGLAPGDSVILSDMARWDSYDRVRLRG